MQNAAPRFRDCGEPAVRRQQARKTADCRTICGVTSTFTIGRPFITSSASAGDSGCAGMSGRSAAMLMTCMAASSRGLGELRHRDAVRQREAAAAGPPQRGQVRPDAKRGSEVVCQRTDIEARRTVEVQGGEAVLEIDEVQARDFDRYRRQCHRRPGARQCVRAMPADFLCGDRRGHLVEMARGNVPAPPRRRRDPAARRRPHRPAFLLRRRCSSPARTGRGLVGLAILARNCARRVARPSSSGRTPGRHRIERAGMSDARLTQRAPRHGDDVVRGEAGGLVDDETALGRAGASPAAPHARAARRDRARAPAAIAGVIASSIAARAVG